MTGRHPWPTEEQVARVMSAAGIGPGVRVVAYDDASGSTAARLWYLLRAHGHDEVAVLDGGIARWRAEGRPLSTEDAARRARRVRLPAQARVRGHQDKRWCATTPGGSSSTRASAPRYRGETEPIDPRAGHVPGRPQRALDRESHRRRRAGVPLG